MIFQWKFWPVPITPEPNLGQVFFETQQNFWNFGRIQWNPDNSYPDYSYFRLILTNWPRPGRTNLRNRPKTEEFVVWILWCNSWTVHEALLCREQARVTSLFTGYRQKHEDPLPLQGARVNQLDLCPGLHFTLTLKWQNSTTLKLKQ